MEVCETKNVQVWLNMSSLWFLHNVYLLDCYIFCRKLDDTSGLPSTWYARFINGIRYHWDPSKLLSIRGAGETFTTELLNQHLGTLLGC